MIAYIRRNAVAFVALFIALGGTSVAAVGTITSNDIVDGQVKNQDLAANAVTSDKTANGAITTDDLAPYAVKAGRVAKDTLTGAQVNESTLARVPDAARLGGVDAAEFRPGTAMAIQQTDQCATTGIYRLCAPLTLTVPSGEFYKVDVHTSMTAFGSTAGQGLFCAAAEGPACLNNTPSGLTLIPGQYANVSNDGTAYFGAGTHTFGMAARFDAPIAAGITTANTTTTIRWHRAQSEVADPAFAAARAAKVPSRPPELFAGKSLNRK